MSNTTPIISIIIPVYNVEKYLSKCLDSILNSKLTDFEVILIDDGSKDRSVEICDDYAKSNNKVHVTHQVNAGVSKTRNRGLDQAKGEWIWFVDSDDLVNSKVDYDDVLKKLPKGADYVMFDILHFNEGFAEPNYDCGKVSLEKQQGSKNDTLCRHICYYHPMLWYKRSIIENNHIRFPQDISIGEDLEFQFKYLMHTSMPVKVNAVNYFCRLRDESLTRNSNSDIAGVIALPKVLYNLVAYIRDNKIKPEPWLSKRIEISLLRQYLISANKTSNVNWTDTQQTFDAIISEYNKEGFGLPKMFSLKMALRSVRLYGVTYNVFQWVKRMLGILK